MPRTTRSSPATRTPRSRTRSCARRSPTPTPSCACSPTASTPRCSRRARRRLQVVANVAVGYDNVDVSAATERGRRRVQHPGRARRDDRRPRVPARSSPRRASPRRPRPTCAADRWPGWGITQYLGRDVHGATLGLVGYGRIGQAVGRRAAGFGMQVLHHTRHDTGMPGVACRPRRAARGERHRLAPRPAVRRDAPPDRRRSPRE